MTVHVVAGGQFGSEGKGAFTVELMRHLKIQGVAEAPVLVRVAGPNAGHTAYDKEGRKWALRQIPVGAVHNYKSPIVIGQGSEIDPNVLFEEINALEAADIPVHDRLYIDEEATIITSAHRLSEADIQTGTTGKGIGGARAARILREAPRAIEWAERLGGEDVVGDTVLFLRKVMERRINVIVEGTQGYGLGSHAGYYPYCTSSNCRPGDFLTMTGLQPNDVIGGYTPWLVFRTHPIRIAGRSGPLTHETSWDRIGQDPEFTTVTKKERRVGHWDGALAAKAVLAAGPRVRAVLRFVDYDIDPNSLEEIRRYMYQQEQRFAGLDPVKLHFAGLGPDHGVWRPQAGWMSE